MKRLFVILLLCFFSITPLENVFAQEYDDNYKQNVYSPIPPELGKIKNRFIDWHKRNAVQVERIKTSSHPKVVAWREAVMGIQEKDELAFLNQINKISNNAVHYVDDYKHFGKEFWAGPYRTLTEGGDCEDIAFLKVAALKLRGFDVDKKTRLLIGMIFYQGRNQAHAVLEVDVSGGRHVVMRSLNNDVLTFKKMDDVMKPIYMVNKNELVTFNKNKKYAYLLNDDSSIMPAAGEKKVDYND